ncbi:MAG: hypothetical protein EBZ77_02130 [Chitinophagia bacterium]|nr:hypothetical protein [Chitinophagia bacterium]
MKMANLLALCTAVLLSVTAPVEYTTLIAPRHDRVIYFAPLQFTENGVGFSVAYEKELDRSGIATFTLPAIFTINTSKNVENGTTVTEPNYDPVFYLMPGVRFYPEGSRERVTYSLGANLVLGAGRGTEYPNRFVNTGTRLVIGPMITGGLGLNPTEHFTLGLDFGMGFTYLHSFNGENRATRFLTQGGIKIGYRF